MAIGTNYHALGAKNSLKYPEDGKRPNGTDYRYYVRQSVEPRLIQRPYSNTHKR